MNRTLHFEGYSKDIDLADLLSENYDMDWSFDFDEESGDSVDNVFLRFYDCTSKCSLDDAMKGHLEKMFGKLEAIGQTYGYSEWTITGFSIKSLKLGEHDIKEIIKSKGDRYLHILIDVVK